MQTAKVYRQLLKAVEKHIGKDGSKRHFRDFITEEFQQNAKLSDQAAVQCKVKLAHDYTFLLNSVHHQKEVIFEAMQTAKVYRQLLKAVEKHIGKDGSKRHFRDFITEEFQQNAKLSDQAAVQCKVKLAHDYTFLLNSVHHQKELLFSYNIAVDRSDEMKKILKKSAASVGLQLPDVYQP